MFYSCVHFLSYSLFHNSRPFLCVHVRYSRELWNGLILTCFINIALMCIVCIFVCLMSIGSVHKSICLCIYLSICLSSCLYIYLSVYPAVYISIYLSIQLSIYLSIYVSIHISIYRGIYEKGSGDVISAVCVQMDR